jgi:two-component system, response regulator PdtaR
VVSQDLAPNHEPVGYVLVAEDDVLLRSVVAEAFRDSGLYVIEVANADEAIDYIRTGAPLDIVFSDIDMPGSMDGAALARTVKEKYDTIPVFLTSGTGAIGSGVRYDAFFPKPYSVSAVTRLMREFLLNRKTNE